MYFLADFSKKKMDVREVSRNTLANNVIGDKTTMKKVRKESLEKFKKREKLSDVIDGGDELFQTSSEIVIKQRKEGLKDLKQWIRSKY